MTTPRRHPARSGFTLTELLVAITVIAILAGLLAPALIGALSATREAAVVFEMKQMELAIEQFKNDHGFYPPTIDVDPAKGAAIQTPAQFLQYLNKIAPQNAENSSSFPGSSNSRFADWWINVGSKLDETTSLQFWLSGLCKNKQFPITGGGNVDAPLCAFGADKYSDGSDLPGGVQIERDNYYEFKDKQLNVIGGGAVATYRQPYGASDGDLNFRYLDYKSFLMADGMTPRAYCDGFDASGKPNFVNPKKFQLVTYGRDGEPGDSVDISLAGARGADNICNFVEGRLDKYENQ